MPIQQLSDQQLENMAANYRRSNRTEGGIYSLREVLLEQRRRSPCPFGTRELAAKILESSRASNDGFVTYGELWQSFRPHSPWSGHATQQIVANGLTRVLGYCVQNHLPMITVLVVRGENRQLSDAAVKNINDECKELGVDAGLNPRAFVEREIEKSKAFARASHDLPHE
jgi:hypothetical protein